jgi:molybdopterin-guanine dinucleotide biosynthesis protein MobB
MDIPVLAFAGFSGTGKTTLIEKLIPLLVEKGLTVAVVKHDAHGLTFDHEGKDSQRFSKAGAAYSIVSSGENAAMFISKPLGPYEAVKLAPEGTDLIIVEGYKYADFPQIGLCRKATGKGFTAELSRYEALVTDMEVGDVDIPVFDLNDYEGIADFIYAEYGRFHSFQ